METHGAVSPFAALNLALGLIPRCFENRGTENLISLFCSQQITFLWTGKRRQPTILCILMFVPMSSLEKVWQKNLEKLRLFLCTHFKTDSVTLWVTHAQKILDKTLEPLYSGILKIPTRNGMKGKIGIMYFIYQAFWRMFYNVTSSNIHIRMFYKEADGHLSFATTQYVMNIFFTFW